MRIGLIAMSGVRAHNEELTKLGLTLPGFVERNKIIASLPSLSLLTLAALTPSRHEVVYREVADIRDEPDLPDGFDMVAISSYSAQIGEAYELADRYMARGVPVVMGGPHVSALPDEASAHCTSVALGEGEPLWPRIIADLERGRLAARYVQDRPGDYDLADAPVPRFDLLDPERYNRLTVQTSRGCPHRCEFCASSLLQSPRYKLKPVPKVIEEIRAIKRIWEKPFIEFADDNSFAAHGHARELVRALIPERIRWFTETDISVAEDDELLGLMRDAGCQQILIGLESPGPAALDGLELGANWKRRQLDHYQEAVEKVQSYGITVNGCFVLGLDGDTAQVFDDVLQFVRDTRLYEVQVTFLTPFPGTPLYLRLKQEGRLIRDGAWELCTLFDINFVPRNMTAQELHDGGLRLGKVLYSEEATAERRSRFRTMLRTSPNASRHRDRPGDAHVHQSS